MTSANSHAARCNVLSVPTGPDPDPDSHASATNAASKLHDDLILCPVPGGVCARRVLDGRRAAAHGRARQRHCALPSQQLLLCRSPVEVRVRVACCSDVGRFCSARRMLCALWSPICRAGTRLLTGMLEVCFGASARREIRAQRFCKYPHVAGALTYPSTCAHAYSTTAQRLTMTSPG